MSEDEEIFLAKKIQIDSDCELDSLARIPSLNTSYSTLHSPSHIKHSDDMSYYTRSQRPGGSDPPHHHYHDSEDDPYGSRDRQSHSYHTTPVKKLKLKGAHETEVYDLKEDVGNRPPPHPVRREYSDMYLESNLRTPRYNTHTSYDEMVDHLAEEDPFKGQYVPSGKSKKVKKKHKHSESELSLTAEGHSFNSSSSRKQKKKKKKEAESMDSTHTYTVKLEGRTNMSYSNAETSSVKSNGTYTLGGKEDTVDAPRALRSGDQDVSSPRPKLNSIRNKRGSSYRSRGSGSTNKINKECFRAFVKDNKIMQRVPKSENKTEKKEIWHYHTHTDPVPCDSFGHIHFVGFGVDNDDSPYIRISPDTKLELMWQLLIEKWNLYPPQLLISVTGGAKRFEMKERIMEKLKKGLIDAAVSTGAWIITGGSKSGVMEFVGDAVRSHRITSGRKEDVVSLGIATWGMVANRHNLDCEDGQAGNFPAVYSKTDCLDCIPYYPKDVPLDENYSHFILVDDGSEGKFGREIEFRNKFENFVSTQYCDTESKDTSLTVPVIMLIVEGGINSMKTVWGAVTQGTPVLVLESSGRAADFIAHGYKITANRLVEEKSLFPPSFQTEMEQLAESVFEWRPQDETRKPAMIANCIKQLKEALNYRPLLTVFDLKEIDQYEFDKAILYALFKANRANTNAQLSLALAWNRSDIARNEIFDKNNTSKLQDLDLDNAMATALIQDRLEFVKLFLENGINLKLFLDVKNLWNIYCNILQDESDSSAQLLINRIMFLRQTWAAYLCCKPITAIDCQHDLLNDIGKVIVNLLGDESLNPYPGKHFDVPEGLESVFGYIGKDIKTKISDHRLSKGRRLTKSTSRVKHFDFERPEKELFIMCVLLNRMELAKIFWRIGQDHIGTAVFASSLMKAMSKIADDDEEVELSMALSQNAEEFENLACNVLMYCYLRNRDLAHQLLVRKMKAFGNMTLFLMADSSQLMEFMGQTACQTKLNEIWKGRMALYTSTFKIFFSIFLPFVIPSIKFNSKKSPGEIIEESDDSPKFDSMQMNEVMPDKDRVSHKQKISPEDMEDSSLVSKTKIIKHKLYKVQFLGGCTRQSDGINFLSAILYFYTAPVTVFWCNVLAYLVFLSIFSYFVLTDLYPTSHPKSPSTMEIVTWGWTITMVIEELRQLFSKDQRSFLYKFKNWFGNEWNKFDLMMYTLFLTSVVLRFALDDKDFIWARMCYSITLAMYFIRVMQYFYVEKNIGPKVIMINRMLMDLLFFFMILVVFILSFGVMYQANLFPNSPSSWKLLKQVVYHPYWQMYGELFLENLEGQAPDQCTHNETAWRYYGEERCPEQNAFVPLLLAGYMLLTNILLVNLLIAMFSDTFQKVQDNSEKVWRFHRFSLVYEFYDRPTLIPPLIFINHIFRGVRWIIYKCTGKFKYNNVFKRFLNNKDDERLRLFEKDAVEEHLHSMWTVEKDKMENKVSSTSERLDKVIEELDKIKEQVQEGSIPGIHHSVQTARSVTVMEDPATTRSHLDSKNLQRQMDELADYVKIQMKDMNEMMKQINMRLQPPPPPQPSTSSRSPGTVLDITDVSNDP